MPPAGAQERTLQDWTSGAPKWAAVAALGLASVGALAYSITRDARPWRAVSPPATAEAQPPAALTPVVANTSARAPAASDSPVAIRRTVNINTANAAELELLPGVGPELAKRIVEHRTRYGAFKRVDDLDAVRGIGARMLERVRPFAAVE